MQYSIGELDSILSTWHFGVVQNVESLKSDLWLVTSEMGTYVLKRKSDINKVMRERVLLDYLKTYGVAAHTMVASYPTGDGRVFCQYPYISGNTSLDGSSYTNSKTIGEEIGRLHVALTLFGETSGFPVKDNYGSIFSSVLQILDGIQNDIIVTLKHVLTGLQTEALVLNQLPVQLIHRDTHGDNMIFSNGEFKGFIDFDLVEVNTRLFDPCYAAMGVLPLHFEETGFEKQWIHFLGDILDGYNRINPLTLGETRALWFMLLAIEVLFVAIFIHSSPKIAEKNAKICMWLVQIRDDVEKLGLELESRLSNNEGMPSKTTL